MAATAIITCPECDKKFKGKAALQGKKIRCPFCKEAFVVPLEDEEQATVPPRDARTAAKKGAKGKEAAPAHASAPAAAQAGGDEEEEGSNPYGVTKLDLAPRCPNCANEMESEEAVVCLFCGYNTLTRTWGKTEKVFAHTFGDYLRHLLPGLLCVLLIFLLIPGTIYYCLVLPTIPKWRWLEFTDHESMRLWLVVFVLLVAWPSGYYAFNRLIINAKPPDKKKD